MKKFDPYLYIIIALLAFGSCKPVKVLEKPELPDIIQADTLLVDSLIPWRGFFQDAKLIKLIDMALDSNFNIRTETIARDIAMKVYDRTRFSYLPTLSAQAFGYNKQYRSEKFYSSPSSGYYEETGKTPPEVLYNYQSQHIHSLQLNWELDIWGRIRDERRSNYAKWMAEAENLKVVQTQIVTAVAESYFNLLMLDEQLKVALNNYTLRNSTNEMMQLQYDAGEVTSLGVLQAQNQVLQASALISQLRRDIVSLENDIRLLCGQLPGAPIERDPFDEPPLSLDLLESVPLAYVQNRPDVIQSMYLLQSANKRIGVAQKLRYPSLNINLTGGLNSMMPENWFNVPGALFGGFTSGISAPILDGKRLRLNVAIAEADRDRAEIQTQKVVYSAIGEVYNSMQSFRQSRSQLEIASEQGNITRQAQSDAYLLYRSGFATYLEVITAQEQAMNAELNLAKMKTQLIIDAIQLYRALGGGWY